MSQKKALSSTASDADSRRHHSAVLGGVSLAIAVGTMALIALIMWGSQDKTSPSVGHPSPHAWGVLFSNCFALLGGLVGLSFALVGLFVGWGAKPSRLTIAAVIVNVLLIAIPVMLGMIHSNRGW